MAFAATARNPLVSEMNITPLVDVMLVLLIIFMVSAPPLTRNVQANLPQRAPDLAQVKPPQLLLEVGDDGAYRLDGRLLAPAEVWNRFDDAVATDPRSVLSVRASSGADYQQVVTALAQARNRGITNLSMQQ